jgi:hypothetical protein
MILYPRVAQLWLAKLPQTALAASTLHLFKANLNIGPNTVLADLIAAEADFSGYAAKTIAAFNDPYIASGGGASITSPFEQFEWVDPIPPALPVPNVIYGFWLEDSTSKLVVVGTLDLPVSVQMVGDAVAITLALNYGKTA